MPVYKKLQKKVLETIVYDIYHVLDKEARTQIEVPEFVDLKKRIVEYMEENNIPEQHPNKITNLRTAVLKEIQGHNRTSELMTSLGHASHRIYIPLEQFYRKS